MTTTDQPILTIEQAADRLGIAVVTLRLRMRRRGTFGAQKIGRRWRFPQSVVNSPLAFTG
jgi:excisionase family DNA binding protein